MNTKNFYWVREPEHYQISEKEIRITTQAHTDLWQKTYYHFVNDNAPLLLMDTEEEYFSFTVKTDFSTAILALTSVASWFIRIRKTGLRARLSMKMRIFSIWAAL